MGWLQALADLVFPPHCLGCGTALSTSVPPLFCPLCRAALPWIEPPWCTCCGAPFRAGTSHVCGACLKNPPPFALARSLFRYENPIRSRILALKFQGDLTLLPSLEALCAEAPACAAFTEPDYLIPVPLHPDRLRERGFNQAQHLARACFPRWRRKLTRQILLRSLATPPQTFLSGRARRRNLRGAFSVADDARLGGTTVLLVDDVFTTGATVSDCCRALRGAGAARIEVFTLGRSVVF